MDPNDPAVIIAAFLLGFLVGRIPSTSWWSSLRWEIKRRTPHRCPQCGKWQTYGHMAGARHRTAGWIRLCQDCHKDLFNPLTQEYYDDSR